MRALIAAPCRLPPCRNNQLSADHGAQPFRWLWRRGTTRSHPEHGRATLQRLWYWAGDCPEESAAAGTPLSAIPGRRVRPGIAPLRVLDMPGLAAYNADAAADPG